MRSRLTLLLLALALLGGCTNTLRGASDDVDRANTEIKRGM